MDDHDHFVQFYESDSFLMDSVSGYVCEGLMGGEGAIIIATDTHRVGIEERLAVAGVDVRAALASGQFVSLNAADVLARFMVRGDPDPVLFEQAVGSVISRTAHDWPAVRAFGEMVALLWADGNAPAHVVLEKLWNDLAKVYDFSLFCAYPMSGFTDHSHGSSVDDICAVHSRVLPTEHYAKLSDEDQRLRQVLQLQQKARSLEAEIEARKLVEAVRDDVTGSARLLKPRIVCYRT
jgi:hypothetical protein